MSAAFVPDTVPVATTEKLLAVQVVFGGVKVTAMLKSVGALPGPLMVPVPSRVSVSVMSAATATAQRHPVELDAVPSGPPKVP